jgi:DNA-binding beta-propeller fold protein YncE
MYIVGNGTEKIYEYDLSIGFDVSSAVYSQDFSVISQEAAATGVAFNNDGTKMFITGIIGGSVYEYDLSTGFDVSSAVYSQSFSVSAQSANPYGLAFNTDGTKMFVCGANSVFRYTLETGFDVSTAVYAQNFSVAAQETDTAGIAFNNDGSKMYIDWI